MTLQKPNTRVIIYTPALLPREAWRALLTKQPFLDVLVTACEVSVIPPLVETDRPNAILVDLPGLRIDVAQQLHAAAPEAGLLFLVDTYALDDMLVLLKSGAIGCISRNASLPQFSRALLAPDAGKLRCLILLLEKLLPY